jgi:ATP-dependent Zn protease
MNTVVKIIFLFLFILITMFSSQMAYCEDVWTYQQLIENLNKGSVQEIAIVPGGIKGQFIDKYGRSEIFMVPENTPGEYSSFSPEIITLIQKHGVHVIPQQNQTAAAFVNYGALFFYISSWIIILIAVLLLAKINSKLNRLLDALNKRS